MPGQISCIVTFLRMLLSCIFDPKYVKHLNKIYLMICNFNLQVMLSYQYTFSVRHMMEPNKQYIYQNLTVKIGYAKIETLHEFTEHELCLI